MVCLAGTVCAQHRFNGPYRGANNQHIAFPIGGMGAGMFCLEGTGAISHMSVRHHPDLYNEPLMFAAIAVKGYTAKVLEGPVPDWKKFGLPNSGSGGGGTSYGLPRFSEASFIARFPFGTVNLKDKALPVTIKIMGWSPFIPTDADNSSLPAGALEYTITNSSEKGQSGVFSFNSANFMVQENAPNQIKAIPGGFILSQDGNKYDPEKRGDFAVFMDAPNTSVDYCWFRGSWWDPLTMAWKKIQKGDTTAVAPVAHDAPGASLYIPFQLKPGESRTIRIMLCWYVPNSHLRSGFNASKASDTTVTDRSRDQPSAYYMPWYASRFKNIGEVADYWKNNYVALRQKTALFTNAFYSQTLPPEVLEAIGNNLSILKSPTVLRQYDGRFWGWEGSNDQEGSCAGNCSHVYNYAQALCHLFPEMERTVDETQFGESQDAAGHQNYRAALPIRAASHDHYLAAADGQLGGIIRVYRDWRISGDDEWLENMLPKVKAALDYSIRTWDPAHRGTISEPHHNTYDIEFWSPEGMCTSIYLGALEAFIKMKEYENKDQQQEQEDLSLYKDLLGKGSSACKNEIYNGRYFSQKVEWKGLRQQPDTADENFRFPEAKALLQVEGPPYQYGNGCLADGVLGAWMAKTAGLPDPLDEQQVSSHLDAVYQYNFKTNLNTYSNPQRPGFALGNEGGLLLCTWPQGGEPSLPFPYSNEVWTGVEFEVASHLIMEGQIKKGMDIVRATCKRYDGGIRNPFDEYEAGHWYTRALSSYALIQAFNGVHYDALTQTLYVKAGNFNSFLSTNTGFGNIIEKTGKTTIKVLYGQIPVKHIQILKS